VWFENKIVMACSASKGASTEGQLTAHFVVQVSKYSSAIQPPLGSLGEPWRLATMVADYICGCDPCELQAPEPC